MVMVMTMMTAGQGGGLSSSWFSDIWAIQGKATARCGYNQRLRTSGTGRGLW